MPMNQPAIKLLVVTFLLSGVALSMSKTHKEPLKHRRMTAQMNSTVADTSISTNFSRGRDLCRRDGRTQRPNANLLFLHIFKAAGSTTRDTLGEYAHKCGLKFSVCGSKCSRSHGNYICLKPKGQAETPSQKSLVRKSDVVAGHLWFGLHRATSAPSLYGARTVFVRCRIRCRIRRSVRVSRDVRHDARTDVRNRGSVVPFQ